MAEPRVTISAIEAVKAIRSGMDDTELMERFKLSAKGLQNLFRHLIDAGILKPSELEARRSSGHGSVGLDLAQVKFPDPKPHKPRIDAAEAQRCIRSGMDDAELMKRFHVSAKGLQSLFTKLLGVGALKPHEIEDRMQTSHSWVTLDEGTRRRAGDGLPQPEIDPNEMRNCVKRGMNRGKLMEHFNLTAPELETILAGLSTTGEISEPERQRALSAERADFQIRNRFTAEIIFAGEGESLKEVVQRGLARGVDFSGAELEGANLSKIDLSGIRLVRANLRKANLVATDLTAARLTEAVLASAELYGAVLYKANLTNADLTDSNFTMVCAMWAFLPGANFSEANLTKADFSGANLARAVLFQTILCQTNFTGAYLEGVDLENANNQGLIL